MKFIVQEKKVANDRSYVCIKRPDNTWFFLITENGSFYWLDGSLGVLTELTNLDFVGLTAKLANGRYKVFGTGMYKVSLFKNIKKEEVI